MKFLVPDAKISLETIGSVRIASATMEKVDDQISTALRSVAIDEAGRKIEAPWMPTNLIGVGEGYSRVFTAGSLFSPTKAPFDVVAAVRSAAGLPAIDRAELADACSATVADGELAAFAKRAGIQEDQLRAAVAAKGHMRMDPSIRITADARKFTLPQELREKAASSIRSALESDVIARRKDKAKTEGVDQRF